jgi:DNA-binding transcriptional regulator YhcF (GntR family)
MADSFPLSLDPDAPLPLYHQIVVGLRYGIATGGIERGQRLPPLREAAERWGVGYHTVRRAYAELEEMGLVRRRQGAGTTVVGSIRSAPVREGEALSRFLDHVVEEGRRRFGLTRREIASELDDDGDGHRDVGTEPRTCTVIECNAHQCADLAEQVRQRFAVDVHEHVLGSHDAPPPGVMIGTCFHFSDLRRRWPERRGDMFFPTLHPDPALRDRLLDVPGAGGEEAVPLCEREPALAEAMAEDVARLLGGVEIVPTVDRSPGEMREACPGGPILVAPRLWDSLPEVLKRDPAVVEVRYVFRPYDLEALARALDWRMKEAVRA